MLRVSQIKCSINHSDADLYGQIRKKLRLRENQPFTCEIVRQSVDAREKANLRYVYTVDVTLCGEEAAEQKVLKALGRKSADVLTVGKAEYRQPTSGEACPGRPPVIIGSGPAGLFCALSLARAGYRPVVIERGDRVEERTGKVEAYWEGGKLDLNSNVQFGEGGAGTFSDGKLNTAIKDPAGRIRFVLKTFAQAGADPDILYSYKPHIGTDVLRGVIRKIRSEILSCGGTFLFRHTLEDIERMPPEDRHPENRELASFEDRHPENRELASPEDRHRAKEESYRLTVKRENGSVTYLFTELVVLAIGHSARDTMEMLLRRGFEMHPKAFAVGVRVQHPQEMINRAMYGEHPPLRLGAAPYKLTCSVEGRGVYSFCMCPGGYVVDASSEEGHLAVNGMSYHGRDSGNANSAIVVTVSPDEYGAQGPLDGIRFVRELEEKAFKAGEGCIPVQTFADFKRSGRGGGSDEPRALETAGECVRPVFKGRWKQADVRGIFPESIGSCIEEGMEIFGKKIAGFNMDGCLLAAVESRTSSPVRITRGEDLCAVSFDGVYPCGEGAGYAGGITSAAVDGLKVAEKIIERYCRGQVSYCKKET